MRYDLFDAHAHIIDPRFPLVAQETTQPDAATPDSYTPDPFTVADYVHTMQVAHKRLPVNCVGGAVVSGSFQGYDQTYLTDALHKLGDGWVGITALPAGTSDDEIRRLDAAGIRGIRFAVRRTVVDPTVLTTLARRVYDLVGWHTEVYADADAITDLVDVLADLPALTIDHLGLAAAGSPALSRLVDTGARIKASGFGRVEGALQDALVRIYRANPDALMFGTDLPGTRSPRRYLAADLVTITESIGTEFGDQAVTKVLHDNAIAWYHRKGT